METQEIELKERIGGKIVEVDGEIGKVIGASFDFAIGGKRPEPLIKIELKDKSICWKTEKELKIT